MAVGLFRHINTLSSLLSWIFIIRESPLTPPIFWLTYLSLCLYFGSLTAFIVAVVLAVFPYFYVSFLRPVENFRCPVWDKVKFPALGAHRGGSSLFGPENTMYNYKRCVYEYAVDILEIDLRLSSDGKIVLLHDDTVNRTTNGTGKVSSFTLEQLKSLNAAWNYPELRHLGITVPTLEEVLKEFIMTDVIFLFDIKDISVVPLIPEIITQWNLKDRIVFSAVDPRSNKALLKILPKSIPIAPDFFTVVKMILLYCVGLSWLIPTRHSLMGAIIIKNTKNLMTRGLFSEWKSRKCLIVLFGDVLDDAQNQRECIKNGIDIILTDRPDVGRQVLGPSHRHHN